MKFYYPDAENIKISASIERLQYLVNTMPALITAIPKKEFEEKPAPGRWSKKEILGHLIDSAANNHQRFIRIQYEDKPVIGYNQDEWVNLTGYHQLEVGHVIKFWAMYNQHIVNILEGVSGENLTKTGLVPSGEEMPLAWYINDYVAHMEHHLREIVYY